MLEKSQSNRMDDQRASLIPYKQPVIKKTLNSCSNKLVTFIRKGSYKRAYTTNCNKDVWEEEEEFSESFTQNDCNNSVMLITNENDKKYYKEIELQQKFNQPKIFRYGKCKDQKYKYKIEERFDEELFDAIEYNFNKNISILDNNQLLNNFKQTFRELLLQVKNIHDSNIGHFDIKPDNIMVKYIKDTTQFEKMVLIDYGFARESPTKTLLGT